MSELFNKRLSLEVKDLDNVQNVFPKIFRWLTVKKDTWRHENEWRYLLPVDPKKPATRKQSFDLDVIDSITLGFSFFKGNELLYDDGEIFKRRLKGNSNSEEPNYYLEILRYLKEYKDTPLFQIALINNLEFYPQKIIIEDLNGDEVTVHRLS